MKLLAPLFIAALLAGCASTPDVKTDADPKANFAGYKTYYWAVKPTGGSPLFEQRMVDGIDARLRAKGWTPAPEGTADVAVAAHVVRSQKQTADTIYTGTSMGGWGWRGGWGGGMGTATTTVRTYDVGTLVVDMFDTTSKQAVWRGTATKTITGSNEQMTTALDAGLDKMFAAFPPGG